MAVLELLRFPASDAVIANVALAQPVLDLLKVAPGYVAAYFGIGIESNKNGYLVVIWESYDHHKQLMDSPNYKKITAAFTPLHTGSYTMEHIAVDKDITPALTAPVTEFALLKRKGSRPQAEYEDAAQRIIDTLGAAKGAHPNACWGVSKENSENFYTITGWDSVEAHTSAVSQDSIKSAVEEVHATFDLAIGHAKLTKH
ncbi:hypothetical protein AMATHDRAFT_53953 [Amanita thiersii Skay4041]|uniref:ABM domain-containing protein n=1 Tax=Amanita thiersii Skay4041 TaxID=703135 RepID=A0A2A9P0N3_9AGAR|nr:hypothetical protein AMATHDRAFT_53953 [Amanita thiersii Skay4041]